MNTQALQPAKTRSIPSVSNKTWIGDLYCSNTHPIIKMNAKSTTAKAINIIMIVMNLSQLLMSGGELLIYPCSLILSAIVCGKKATL